MSDSTLLKTTRGRVRRCVVLIARTLLSLPNQGDVIIAHRFDRGVTLRILGNYLIPFVVADRCADDRRPTGCTMVVRCP